MERSAIQGSDAGGHLVGSILRAWSFQGGEGRLPQAEATNKLIPEGLEETEQTGEGGTVGPWKHVGLCERRLRGEKCEELCRDHLPSHRQEDDPNRSEVHQLMSQLPLGGQLLRSFPEGLCRDHSRAESDVTMSTGGNSSGDGGGGLQEPTESEGWGGSGGDGNSSLLLLHKVPSKSDCASLAAGLAASASEAEAIMAKKRRVMNQARGSGARGVQEA